AMHNYEDANRALPPSKYNRLTGGATWAVLILPFMEGSNGYDLWDLSKEFANPNAALEQTEAARLIRIKAYTCPSRRDGNQYTTMEAGQGGSAGSGGMTDPSRFKPGQAGDYAGNVGTYGKINGTGAFQAVWFSADATGTIIAGATLSATDRTVPVKPLVSLSRILDGTSNTFLLGE